MKRSLGWGMKRARRWGGQGSGLGGWRTGSFKPVGDGFEDGVLLFFR